MFYDIVNNLCKERKTTITRMAEEIGLSNAAPTSWRKGAIPKLTTLEKIADYFDGLCRIRVMACASARDRWA